MSSSKGYRRSIIFECEYQQLKNATADINKQMALLNAEFRRASEEAKASGSSFDRLAITQEKLGIQEKLQKDRIQELKKELDQATKAEGNNEKAIVRKTIELKNAETQLIKIQTQILKTTTDIDDYGKSTADATDKIKVLEAEHKLQLENNKKVSNSFKELIQEQTYYSAKIDLHKEQLTRLNKELEELTQNENKNEKAIASKTLELRNQEFELAKTQTEFEKVNREVDKSTIGFGRASLAVVDFKNNAQKMNVNLSEISSGLTRVVGVVAAVVGATSGMSMSFDDAFTKVKTIADSGEVSFGDLRQGVLDMSRDMDLAHVSANDLASGLYDIISSNIATKDSLDVLRQSAKLAETGFTDMKASTDIMTTIINGYNLSVSDASKVTDQLITIQKLGKLTVEDIGEEFGKVTGLAATANVPLNEMGAALAVLTTKGIQSNEAITAMKAILSNVIKPSSEAAETAKELGIKFNMAALQSKGLANFLQEIQKKCRGNDEAITKLFGSTEALNAILMLTSKEGLSQFNKNANEIEHSSGAADKALGNLDSTSRTLKDSWNDFKTTMIEVGDAFSPIIDFVALLLTGLSKINPNVIIAVGAGIAVAKVLSLISGLLPILAASSTMASAGLTSLGIAGGISTRSLIIFAAIVGVIVGLMAMLSGGAKKAEQDIKNVSGAANDAINGNLAQAESKARSSVNKGANKSYAIGTQYHPGGAAAVHEDEEIIIPNLPRGTKVRSEMETAQDNRSNGPTYVFQSVSVSANNIDEFMESIEIAKRRGAPALK